MFRLRIPRIRRSVVFGMRQRTLDTAAVAKLAAEAQVDRRTVQRAVDHGIDALRNGYGKDRLRAAAKKFGIRL